MLVVDRRIAHASAFRQANHRFIARSVVCGAGDSSLTLPLPAHAAQAGVGEWGLFFFFAVVAVSSSSCFSTRSSANDAGHEQAPDGTCHGDRA